MDMNAILAQAKAWAETQKGKRTMKGIIEEAVETGKPLASGEKVYGRREMREMANALCEMIRRRLPDSIADVGNKLTTSQPVKHKDGTYEVVLHFASDALHRDSLRTDDGGRTGDGIDNIVALFNNGVDASGYTYGWWDGHSPTGKIAWMHSSADDDYAWVRSAKHREALLFMQDAQEEFNRIYGDKYGVTVQLGSDYTDYTKA